MIHGTFEEAVDLYRSGELDLARAAARAGVSADDLALELRSRGVILREDDQPAVTSTRY
jgi:predicted HTH domain antitoxin